MSNSVFTIASFQLLFIFFSFHFLSLLAIRSTLMMNPTKILRSLAFNATSESKPHIQIPIMPPSLPSLDLKHKKSVSIRRYSSSVQFAKMDGSKSLKFTFYSRFSTLHLIKVGKQIKKSTAPGTPKHEIFEKYAASILQGSAILNRVSLIMAPRKPAIVSLWVGAVISSWCNFITVLYVEHALMISAGTLLKKITYEHKIADAQSSPNFSILGVVMICGAFRQLVGSHFYFES
uniref:Uncharacterized protein n=1 Tax=Cucumis melo TaxID=3656 RepID=A0A9I9E5F1_CUCME